MSLELVYCRLHCNEWGQNRSRGIILLTCLPLCPPLALFMLKSKINYNNRILSIINLKGYNLIQIKLILSDMIFTIYWISIITHDTYTRTLSSPTLSNLQVLDRLIICIRTNLWRKCSQSWLLWTTLCGVNSCGFHQSTVTICHNSGWNTHLFLLLSAL